MESEKIFSVNDINTRVQAIVQSETIGKPFWTAGIVKNKHQSDRGHIYFRLEDDPWSIRCMIPESLRGEMAFTVQNRMEVEVYGDIRVYDRQARIEIQVQRVKLIERPSIPDFRDAEEYLRGKGLWGLTKKDLPKEPKRIVLVTSERSKAVEDFKQTYNRNVQPDKAAEIFVEDVPIEGEFAPARIAEAIEKVNNSGMADIIVVTRGGGQ